MLSRPAIGITRISVTAGAPRDTRDVADDVMVEPFAVVIQRICCPMSRTAPTEEMAMESRRSRTGSSSVLTNREAA